MQADRVDKSAMGFDYQGKTEKHESQKGWSGPPGAPASACCHPLLSCPVVKCSDKPHQHDDAILLVNTETSIWM